MENTSDTPSNDVPADAGETAATTEKPAPQMSPAGRQALNILMDREASVRQQEQTLKKQAAEITRMREEHERAQNPGNPDPTETVSNEVSELRKELQAIKDREQAYRQQTLVEEEKARVRAALSGKDEFKAIAAAEAYDTVFETMLHHYNQTGTWITETEAAAKVNEQLVGLARKLAPLLQEDKPAPNQQSFESPTEAYNTLQNRMTSESASQSTTAQDPQSVLREAAKLLRYKTS